MKYLITFIFILLSIPAYIACTSSRKYPVRESNKQLDSISIKLDTVMSFENLINKEVRYANNYRNLLDSLRLNKADTVGFFIRPCFTHYGIVFKKNGARCKAYYFNFTRHENQVNLIDNSCRISNDYLSFLYDKKLNKNEPSDNGMTITPSCPVVMFLKIGNNFYCKEIDDSKAIYFSEVSINFKRLLLELRENLK
jgi:hypothetical protein